MRRINRIAAAFLIASSIFLTVCFGKDVEPAEPPEEPKPMTPVYDDSAELLALEQRRQAEDKADAEAKEAERQRHIAIEVARVAKAEEVARATKEKAQAEAKRKQALLAKQAASKPKTVSRGQAYVGKAQTYVATHYTAFCPTGCTGVTASGYDVSGTIYYDGMRILAAPKHVPLYSIMRVTMTDGSTFDGIVLDRGGNIGIGRLDILVSNRDEAYRLGRQSVEVRMVRKGR